MLHITVESAPPLDRLCERSLAHCALWFFMRSHALSTWTPLWGSQLMITFISNFRFLTLNNSTLAFIPTCSQWSRGVTGRQHGHMLQNEFILNIRGVTTPLCHGCSHVAPCCCGCSIGQWSFMAWANKVCTGLVRSVQQPDPKWIYDSLNGQNALCENTEYQALQHNCLQPKSI